MITASSQSVADSARLILVTGPTRSGKSDWAETLAQRSQQPVLYIATASNPTDDPEWQARIQAHRDRRPPEWMLWEIPLALSQAVRDAPSHCCILIDALGTWVANSLTQPDDEWQTTTAELLATLQQSPNRIILVAEETGWGLVPPYPAGRLFRDRLGTLTRQVGTLANRVYLVVAGYAVDLQQWGEKLNPES
ncbi:MAG TPA: bifunctional adenosylcobinamide kinase/adenosylcobinamide-phosphate guanylyltransferase [Stenomitos sp.]